jgi:hypothetical protein
MQGLFVTVHALDFAAVRSVSPPISLVDRPIFAHFPARSKLASSSPTLESLLMSRRILSWGWV